MNFHPSTQTAAKAHLLGNNLMPLLVILLLLLATGLRFYQLDNQSFWNDEGNSARLSERTLPLIIEGTASDVHPPLYYVLLRGWRELLGENEFGLRSFSAFAGILTVAATIALARFFFSSFRRRPPSVLTLLAGLFAALNPALVYYSQETRMYALLALISSLSTLILLGWLTHDRRWAWALAYTLLTTAGLYTHYFYPTVIVFQGFIILGWLLRKYVTLVFAPLQLTAEPNWPRVPLTWLLTVGISLTLYLPWVPTFLRQTAGRSSERASIPTFLWDSLRWMAFGETITDQELIWVTVIVIFLLFWAIIRQGRHVVTPLLGVVFPLFAMYLAGTTNHAFFKFMIIAIPFFCIWLAGSVGNFATVSSRGWDIVQTVAWIFILPVLGGMLFSLQNLYDDPAYARADYRAMAAEIARAENSNAGIILNAPNQWEVFTYYYQGSAPVYPLPKGQPDPQILEPQLAGIAGNHERLYVLFWGEDQRDPERVVETWLDTNTFKASEKWIGDVRFAIYATAEGLIEQNPSQEINFDDKISLRSYAIVNDKLAPGDIIQVGLFWSAEDVLEERYKVFLHLVDAAGTIVAQQDGEPVGGMSPTTSWKPGELVIDRHGVFLPETLAPGEYQLLLGLYNVRDPGARLNIQNRPEAQDHIVLDTIIVE